MLGYVRIETGQQKLLTKKSYFQKMLFNSNLLIYIYSDKIKSEEQEE